MGCLSSKSKDGDSEQLDPNKLYKIISVKDNNLVLDRGALDDSLSTICLYEFNGGQNQQWKSIPEGTNMYLASPFSPFSVLEGQPNEDIKMNVKGEVMGQQLWSLQKVDGKSGHFIVWNKEYQKCIQYTNNGEDVHLREVSPSGPFTEQEILWKFEEIPTLDSCANAEKLMLDPNGAYKIISIQDDTVLERSGDGDDAETLVICEKYEGRVSQKWKLKMEGNSLIISMTVAPFTVMASLENSQTVLNILKDGELHQRWCVQAPDDKGQVSLWNKLYKRCLQNDGPDGEARMASTDISPGSTLSNKQLWKFEKLPDPPPPSSKPPKKPAPSKAAVSKGNKTQKGGENKGKKK